MESFASSGSVVDDAICEREICRVVKAGRSNTVDSPGGSLM